LIQVGEGLVELVESNEFETEQARQLLTSYVKPMIDAGVDQIVLGCTHYPFFIPLLNQMVPDSIQIIDPAPAIAIRTRNLLIERGLQNNSKLMEHEFYTTGEYVVLNTLIKQITGIAFQAGKIVIS
jgi:glutamate racemase